jgi:flagellar biogenesis protein FliO
VWNKEFTMPADPSPPSTQPPATEPTEKGGVGLFQLLGLGLLLLFVLIFIFMVVWSLFT